MIKRNYYKVVRVFPDPSSYFYIKNETMNRGSVIFLNSSWLSTLNLEYSYDKVNWTVCSDTISVLEDSFVYFRNTSGTFNTKNLKSSFFINFNSSLGGDVRTLFNYTDVDSVTAIPEYGLSYAFQCVGNYKIIDISNLSFRGITSIGDYGLNGTFDNNSSFFEITKGVDLRDVTTLGVRALDSLYYNNKNITEVYAPNVSTWDVSKTDSWLYVVAPTGVVYKPSTLDIPTGDSSSIPSGWTTQDYPTE